MEPQAPGAAVAYPRSPAPYTREGLVAEIRGIALELGRPPKLKDIDERSRRDRCASRTTFLRFFGSMAEIRRIAEEALRTNEELVGIIESALYMKRGASFNWEWVIPDRLRDPAVSSLYELVARAHAASGTAPQAP